MAAGICDRADWPLVEIVALRIARMRQARRVVDREGMTTMSTKGTVMVHPAARLEREAAAEVRQLLDQLGIGPIGRARLGKSGVRPSAPQGDVFVQMAALRERRAARTLQG